MTIEEGLKLCVDALKKVLNHDFNEKRIDASVIRIENGSMQKIPREQIKKLLK